MQIVEPSVDIWNCSACGEQHNDLPIRPLGEDDKEDAFDVVFLRRYKYVAVCPRTQKKLYVSFHTAQLAQPLAQENDRG